ncbi:MAG: hypothetical protein ACHP65_08850, partial [Legionellales bacterium]
MLTPKFQASQLIEKKRKQTQSAVDLLNKIQSDIIVEAEPLSEAALKEEAAKRIPFLSKWLVNIDAVGGSVVRLGLNANRINPELGTLTGFQFGGVALAGLDFLRVPLIYFAAFLLKEKLPSELKLNNNLRWLYSTLSLTLTVTALFIPPVGIAAAGLAWAYSTYLAAKTVMNYYKIKKEQKQVGAELTLIHQEIAKIRAEGVAWTNMPENAANMPGNSVKIERLYERFNIEQDKLKFFKTAELQLEQKAEQTGLVTVIDKSVGKILTMVAFAGAVVSLFFPPVGLGLMAASAIAGGAYAFARIVAIPLFYRVKNKLESSKTQPIPLVSSALCKLSAHSEEALNQLDGDVAKKD